MNLQPETITDVLDYQILQSASLLDFEITGGLTILDDTEDGFRSASSTIVINSISETEIEIEFSFEREDGETINGNYNGEYTVLNN